MKNRSFQQKLNEKEAMCQKMNAYIKAHKCRPQQASNISQEDLRLLKFYKAHSRDINDFLAKKQAKDNEKIELKEKLMQASEEAKENYNRKVELERQNNHLLMQIQEM